MARIEVNKFLNRLMALPYGEGNTLFKEFFDKYREIKQSAIANGTHDAGTRRLIAQRVELVSCRAVADNILFYQLKAWRENKRLASSDIVFDGKDVYQNNRTSKLFVADSWVFGESSIKLQGVDSAAYVSADSLSRNYTLLHDGFGKLTPADIVRRWEKEYRSAPELKPHDVYLFSGALLNIWSKLPIESTPKMRLVTLDDGRNILGRVIGKNDVALALNMLGF